MAEQSQAGLQYDEIDVGALLQLLWKGRLTILVVTAACVAGGVAYAFLTREWYRAEVVLMQTDNKSASPVLAQLGNLASLAGINMGGASGSQAPVAVLRSRDFARDFIQEEGLLQQVLFDQWDAGTKRWRASNPEDVPDIRDAVQRFDEDIRSISESKKNGLLTLSIRWTEPETAAIWANLLVARANKRLREQALVDADANIKYLQKEMAATNVAALQRSIGMILEAEMQKMMLARGAEQYAFRVIDPATPPKYRDSPHRIMIVLASTLMGIFFSVLFVVGRSRISRLPPS